MSPSTAMEGGDPSSEGQVVSDIADTSDDVVESVSENGSSSSETGGSGDRGDPVLGGGGAACLRVDSGGVEPSRFSGKVLLLSGTLVEPPTIKAHVGSIGVNRSIGESLDDRGNISTVVESEDIAGSGDCRPSLA